MQGNDKLMNRAEAIVHLTHAWGFRRSPITLSKWASAGTGPPFRKLGRYTYYSESDLDEWMQSRLSKRQQSIKSPAAPQSTEAPDARPP
jgi:predicted DNA-binding transcriptional regulator AlpA